MYSKDCCKNPNEYYNWNYVTLHCKDCKNIKILNLKCMTSEEQLRVSQSELSKTPYDKVQKRETKLLKQAKKLRRLKLY